MRILLGNSLWHLVTQSDVMTKLVLLGLVLASIACWGIVFYKLVLFRLKHKQLKKMVHDIKQVETLEELVDFTNQYSKTYPGHLLIDQLEHAKKTLQHGSKKGLSHQEMLLLDEHRYSCIDDMLYREESYLSILLVSAQVSPLVGLFGTVWGLTHAFISIGEKQAADIVTIAPGIAEALLTTLAGLMVAVPVSIAYHYLRGRVEEVEYQLHKISETINTVVRVTLLQGKDGSEISLVPKKAKKGTVTS